MSATTLDIHQLIAFDLLVTELQVTRAAQTMGVSQPAMSHILARLRAHFKDPLLVRTTRGMEATPRALELIEPIRIALRHLRNVANVQAAFDAKSSTQSFNIRMGDMNEFLLLPSILSELQTTAPKLSITVSHLSPAATLKALDTAKSISRSVRGYLIQNRYVRPNCCKTRWFAYFARAILVLSVHLTSTHFCSFAISTLFSRQPTHVLSKATFHAIMCAAMLY